MSKTPKEPSQFQKYCNNKIICWIFLIIFAPLGFIMTAKNKTFKPIIKGIILFIFAFVAIYEILFLGVPQVNKFIAFVNGDNNPRVEQASVKIKSVKKVTTKETNNNGTKNDSILEQIKNGTYKPDGSASKFEKRTFNSNTDYRNFVSKSAELFSKDSSNVVSALQSKNYEQVKDLSKFVVEDCGYLESATAPDKFKDVQNKMNQACEIYKNVFSQLYDKIQANDSNWIEQQTENIEKATNLMNQATKEAENIINK